MSIWKSLILFCIVSVIVTVMFSQWIWVRTAYELELKELHILVENFMNEREDILLKQINTLKNSRPSSNELTDEYISQEEKRMKSFLDSLFLEAEMDQFDFGYQVLSQSALKKNPDFSLFKSLTFDRRLRNSGAILIEKILFDNVKKNIFSYESEEEIFKFQLLYEPNFFLVLNRIKSILIGAILMLIMSMITLIIYFYSIFKQRQFDKVKDDFFNGMTHELNTPIAVIQLAAQYLAQANKKKDSLVDETAQVIQHETQRMSNIVRNLLASAKLQKDQLKLELELVKLEDIFEKAVDVYIFHLKKIDYKVLTDFQTNAYVNGDVFHLTHLFSNLIDNSIKYRDRTRNLNIRVKSYVVKDQCFFEFTDNGIGMKSEEIKKIFNPFFRIESTKDIAKGFGLGLSYVRDVLKLHKGTIKIDSRIGEGTTFILSIPIAKK